MKSDANKILRSGWGLFLVVSLLVSVAMDFANPSITRPDGGRFNLFGNGSATLGWLIVISIFILPSYLLRAFGKTPINQLLAAFLCFVGFFGWTALHTASEPNIPARFNFTMWGCLVLAWRLLTTQRIETFDDDCTKPIEPDDSSATKLGPLSTSIGGNIDKHTSEPSPNLTHTESLKISSHKKKWIIGGLLIILLSFGVNGIVEDESPNLSWSFISCGIWASLAYLAPDKWFHFPRLQVNWRKVRLWVGYALLVTAFIAGLMLLMKAFERSAEQSAGVKAAGWEIVTIEDGDYVTADSISRFYRFESSHIEDSNFFLRSNNLILMAKIGSQEILINNIKFRLQKKIVQIGDDVLFSRLDLVKHIDPVLRPAMIEFAGAFDTVIIDAGHGGNDKGKVGIFGYEKDLTLKLALALERELMQRGFKVIMTRRGDSSLLESERVDIANNATTSKAILISLHFGSGGSEETGIQTLSLVSHPSDTGSSLDVASFALAAAVHAMIISRFKFVDLGIGSSSSMQFHGCKWPGIIFEGGFLTNEKECMLLASDTYRNSVSSAITDAVVNYQKAMAGTRR